MTGGHDGFRPVEIPVKKCVAAEQPLAKGCRLVFVPDRDKVVTKRRGTALAEWNDPFIGNVLGFKEYGLHEHTVDQEVKTIANRHMMETPEPQTKSEEWRCFVEAGRCLSKEIGRVGKAGVKEILGNKAGRARKRMKQGLNSYFSEGLKSSHSLIKEMQKLEFYEVDKLETKEDRGIQYRSVEYNAALARFWTRIEHRMIKCVAGNEAGIPIAAKGQNWEQRANCFFKAYLSFTNPVILMGDHKRFDAHYNEELLKQAHIRQLRATGFDPEHKKLLKRQFKNIGRSKGGVEYICWAKRMSGEVTTGGENTETNDCMIAGWIKFNEKRLKRKIRSVRRSDGDDFHIIMDYSDYLLMSNLEDYFLKMGMETEIQVSQDIHDLEFCQSKLVLCKGKPLFGPNPRKVLSSALRCPDTRTPETSVPVLRSSLSGWLAVAPNYPCFRPFMEWLRSNPGHIYDDPRFAYRIGEYGGAVHSLEWEEPSEDERIAFYRAWGILGWQQRSIESDLTLVSPKPRREARFRVSDGLEDLDYVSFDPPECFDGTEAGVASSFEWDDFNPVEKEIIHSLLVD
jgi:hypothetical protein